MDAYARILERLREDGFRRLRAFPGGDEGRLTRWLVVVARRICTDLLRERYGRMRDSTPEVDREARRRLVDEIWEPREAADLPSGPVADPEWQLRLEERRKALAEVVARLEPEDQLLLALRFQDGLTARRIADLRNFPTPFHVYRRLNKILAVLRGRLERMGIRDSRP